MMIRFIALFILVAIGTNLLHEAAHWVTGQLLGYDMWVNINSAGLESGQYRLASHPQIVSIAGPIFTMLQGLVAYLIFRKNKSLIAFAFIFAAFMMRFVAGLMSLSNPNDEARVSEYLGLGPWTLHIVVVAILLGLTILAGRQTKLRLRDYTLAYVATSIGFACVIMGEAYVPRLSF